MKAGPKAAVDPSPLPWAPRSLSAPRFAMFCERFVVTPKGTGARRAMRLRPWPLDLCGLSPGRTSSKQTVLTGWRASVRTPTRH